jgi:hypothetical protein
MRRATRSPTSDLVATYRVDGDGKVTALRAYWSIDKLRFG